MIKNIIKLDGTQEPFNAAKANRWCEWGTDGIPTIKALHTRMQKDGLMVKLNYTTQDYLKIEKFIKHELDFEQPHFALHQIRKKYALGNRVTGAEYESPQFTYIRMAMALAEHEPKAKRLMLNRLTLKYSVIIRMPNTVKNLTS